MAVHIYMLPLEMVERLKGIAKNEICNTDDDDFDPRDFSGGNFDDTYWGGREDGRTVLAREVLESIGVEW